MFSEVFKIKFKNDIKFYKPIEIFNLGGSENTSIHPFIFIDLEKMQMFKFFNITQPMPDY